MLTYWAGRKREHIIACGTDKHASGNWEQQRYSSETKISKSQISGDNGKTKLLQPSKFAYYT